MPLKDDAYYDGMTDETFLKDFHGPSMYSTEGDDAVRAALALIAAMVPGHDAGLNPAMAAKYGKAHLTAIAAPILKAVASAFPEVYDTEPRAWIAEKLDAICEAKGWDYASYENYDW